MTKYYDYKECIEAMNDRETRKQKQIYNQMWSFYRGHLRDFGKTQALKSIAFLLLRKARFYYKDACHKENFNGSIDVNCIALEEIGYMTQNQFLNYLEKFGGHKLREAFVNALFMKNYPENTLYYIDDMFLSNLEIMKNEAN